MTVKGLKHSRITALYVALVTKGRLESPKCNFLEASRHKIR